MSQISLFVFFTFNPGQITYYLCLHVISLNKKTQFLIFHKLRFLDFTHVRFTLES